MKRWLAGFSALVLFLGLFTGFVRAADATAEVKPATAKKARIQVPPGQPADQPAIKGEAGPKNEFVKRHEGFLGDLKAMNGDVGILFLGDSITDGWRKPKGESIKGGREVFDKYYGDMRPLNIGIGGDRTQHVIWRLENGEVAGISPKVVVLMIGTNNLGDNTDEQIVAADTKIVGLLKEKLPKTKVLLLGIFPRGAKPEVKERARIKAINEQLAKLDDGGKTVKYLDIGPQFLDAEGNIAPEIMSDALHPTAKGYEIWAEAIKPTLAELMK